VRYASPELLQLAERLRELREQHWPGIRLTQAALAGALGEDEPLAAATVSSWESHVAPKMPPPERLLAYARFFATRRSVEGRERPRLVPADKLSDEEEEEYRELAEELLALRDAAGRSALRGGQAAPGFWEFSDPGPVDIVCAQLPPEQADKLANPALPNFTELRSFADLDSLIQLYGHIRAENPATPAYFRASAKVVPDDLTGHVVLLGWMISDEKTESLSEMTGLPVRQVTDPAVATGKIFVVTEDGKELKFFPKWRDGNSGYLREDIGLLARTQNPLNSSRTLTICNGIHTRGVLGAVRSLTDAQLREPNEEYLHQEFGDSPAFAMLVRVPVLEGQAMTPDFNSAGCVLYRWPAGHDDR
jgi:transcriptional regulator with XRE-family HTH domain